MIADNGDGTYSVVFELSNAGSHQFYITIAKMSVQGSPYVIHLEQSVAPPPPVIRLEQQAGNSKSFYTYFLTVPQTISLQIILMSRLRLQEKKESVKLTLQLFAIPLEAWVTICLIDSKKLS